MGELQNELLDLRVRYFTKQNKLPKCFKKQQNVYETILGAMLVHSSPLCFLVAITSLLEPKYKKAHAQFNDNPDIYSTYIQWYVEQRTNLEAELTAAYLQEGDSTKGRAILKILEKRFRDNFNDKAIELKELREGGQVNTDTKIEFVLN